MFSSSHDEIYESAAKYLSLYPELHWYAYADVTATNEAVTTQSPEGSYAKRFGKNGVFPEFERSLCCLRCFDLLLEGSKAAYEEFTNSQPLNIKLKFEHFQTLCRRWRDVEDSHPSLNCEDLRAAARAAIVLGDIGKTGDARRLMSRFQIMAEDHDDFYADVMAHPEAADDLPTFRRLNLGQRVLLRKTADLAHFGHITHCEGGPEMFADLKTSNILTKDPRAFDFAVHVYVCDVAGALGHRSNKGSRSYDDQTFRAIEAAIDACRSLKTQDEAFAYEHYLRKRADWLGIMLTSESDRILVRVGAMMRLFEPEQGKALREGFASLPAREQKNALRYLSPIADSYFQRTPTYLPAVLVNLLNNERTAQTQHERICKAIRIGVPYIVEALRKYNNLLLRKEISNAVPLNFNRIAGLMAGEKWYIGLKNIDITTDGDVRDVPRSNRRSIG
ncbi:MAG TPA: hypothetical protein VGZ00_09525 [Candidatus Baltobacteraceae bacterium]|jgi:hypothetical protein|nr:hypothetical protein [Candidatus Baltobacteraceae bacterium]